MLWLASVGSTNDEALARMAAGRRLLVVADRQDQGRGRGGRTFVSPRGGLYASLLLPRLGLEAPVPVALGGVLAASAIEEVALEVPVGLKWPNDLWVGGKKVGGVLIEARGDSPCLVLGVGVNLAVVPTLSDPAAGPVTALDLEAGGPVPRQRLLGALLRHATRWIEDLAADPGAATERLEARWRERLLFRGRRVAYSCAGRPEEGILEEVSLTRGLLVREPQGQVRWRPGAHVRDLRPL